MKVKVLTMVSIMLALFAVSCRNNDADLQKSITDKLTADKVAGVTVAVKDGVATITGEAADAAAKAKVEAAVKGIAGVKSVSNNMTLKPVPVATPVAVDPALTGKITEDLKKKGCTGASVAVVNGKVTVTGEIASAKYLECMQVIQQSGATGVDNQLKKGK